MNIAATKLKIKYSHCLAISILAMLLFAASSLPALAEDATSIETLRRMGKAFASIAEKASPAVVGVKAEKVITREDYPSLREWPFGDPFEPFGDDLFNYFFRYRSPRRRSDRQPEYRQTAQGSGFIISDDGYILTNNHLVGEAEKVTVRLADDRELDAEIKGTDRESDVALIKIDADNLPTVRLGDSDALEVGEWVIAIGNPFKLSHTVTAGIVSAKGRSGLGVAEFEDFIQTDAAINFGNSGGPLLNLNGEVIGINTAIIGPGGNIGIGLAIPINMARQVYPRLMEGGKVVRGYLGIWYEPLTPKLADAFGLEDTEGVAVSEVIEDSPAEKAGLKPNDIIVEFDGEPVKNANEFRNRVAMTKPDKEVDIVVLRNGKREKFAAKLANRSEAGIGRAPSEAMEQLGLTVQPLTTDLARRLGYEGLTGVVVTEVGQGSLADRAGISVGALIMEVNQQQVESVREFNQAVQKAAKEGKALLRIKYEDYTRFIVLPLPKK
jgi:serine protease Do